MNLIELIAALEAVEGPSRELDMEIDRQRTGWTMDWCDENKISVFAVISGRIEKCRIIGYTSSIDDSLTLVPKDCDVDMNQRRKESSCSVMRNYGYEKLHVGWHKCLEIAICIAALRARSDLEGRG